MDDIVTLILMGGIVGIVGLFSFYIFKMYFLPKRIDEIAVMIESGQVALALKKLLALVEDDDHNPYIHFLLGEAYLKNGQTAEAIMEYKQAVRYVVRDSKIKEENIRARLAKLYLDTHNYNEAKKEFLILTKLAPNVGDNFYQVGLLFENAGLGDKALPYYIQAAKIQPRHSDAQYHIGAIQYNAKNIRSAKEALTEAVRVNPKHYAAHYYLGQCLRSEKELDAAMREFDASSKDSAWRGRATMGKGLCYYEKEQYRKAITEFESALESAEGSNELKLNSYYFIAASAEKLRDFNLAINNWEKIMEINPKFRDTPEKLATFEEFRTHDSIKDFMIASPGKFEKICRDLVEKEGYNVTDLEVKNDSLVTLIAVDSGDQGFRTSKRPSTLFFIFRTTEQISEKELRIMHESMRAKSITKGICMTTGEFSTQAELFCQSRPIELKDKKELITKLRGVV
ncbi:MAG: tetratricopeptide repeat protein [Spirochaetia bacterium]|nr:tetratricopeptide repeat protein [Spirochaetia bacterium]